MSWQRGEMVLYLTRLRRAWYVLAGVLCRFYSCRIDGFVIPAGVRDLLTPGSVKDRVLAGWRGADRESSTR